MTDLDEIEIQRAYYAQTAGEYDTLHVSDLAKESVLQNPKTPGMTGVSGV